MLPVERSQTGAVPACPLREGSCFELKHKHRAKTQVHIKCIEQTVKNMHFWNRLFMSRTLLMHAIIVLICNITIFSLSSLLWVYIWNAHRLIMRLIMDPYYIFSSLILYYIVQAQATQVYVFSSFNGIILAVALYLFLHSPGHFHSCWCSVGTPI